MSATAQIELATWLFFTVIYLASAAVRFGDAIAKVDHLEDAGIDGGMIILARARFYSTAAETAAAALLVAAGLVGVVGLASYIAIPLILAVCILCINGFVFMGAVRRAVKVERSYVERTDATEGTPGLQTDSRRADEQAGRRANGDNSASRS